MESNRFFGGNPAAIVLRLAVISVIVGIVLSALDIRPPEIFHHLRVLAQRIYELGFGTVSGLLGYLLVGAVIVVPVWLASRLLSGLRGKDENRHP